MNIELRNIKHAAFASQETDCFEATIWIDGKKSGTVSNDGHGGAHMFHPYALAESLNAYGKTLPMRSSKTLQIEGDSFEYAQDAESLINDLLTAWLIERDFKRAVKSKLLFTKADGKVYQTKKCSPELLNRLTADAAMRKVQLDKLGAVVCLNFMPLPEALAIYGST